MACMLGAEHVHLVNRWQRQMHGQPVIFQPRQYRIRSARLHCVVRGESADQPKAGAASQKVGAQSFRSRLHSNPAYQRFKERKGPPSQKQATAPTGDVKGPTSSSPATVLQSPSLQPEGTTLDPHSLLTQSKANSGTSHSAASQHSQSPGRNQSITFQPQNTPGKPRPFLQPLSAQTQSPYALAESQPSVPRHVDFAEGVQHKKTTARSSASAANFWLTFHAEFGQRLRIVGSHKNLGSWLLVEGPELQWTEGDRWHAKVELPSGTIYEYKYVILDSSGTNALKWQRGNNSVLAIKQDEAQLEVFDNWEGQPGAAVMSGGKSSTRESKLLAWATDIEDQMNLQRQELRQTRIELAAAQEEARKARQETRALRMELAQSQSVRAQADRLIRQLQSSNRMLRSELQQTTTSFRDVLHAATTRLSTVEEEEDQEPMNQLPKSAGSMTGRQSRSSPPTEAARPPSPTPPAASGPLPVTSQPPPVATQPLPAESQPPPAGSQPLPKPSQVGAQPSLASAEPQVKSHQPPPESVQAPVQPPPASVQAPVQPPPTSTQATGLSSGLQESALESTTSSNARHHSMTSKASGGLQDPIQASGAAPGKSSLVPSAAETMEPDVKASADQSQPQLHELPKHSKSPVAGSHASPLKASAGFPESAPSDTLETLDPAAAAGKQFEQSRTGIPPPSEESTTAAVSGQADDSLSAKAASLSQADVSATSEAAPTAQSDGANPTEVASSGHADVVTAKAASKRKQAVSELEKPAGEELQQKANAIPPRTEKSNAAAAASVQAAPAAPSEPAVKAAKGTARKVPASTKTATTVAKQTRTRTKSAKKLAPASKQIDQTTIDQTMSGNAAEQDKSAGKELQQSVHSIPPSTEDSNAAAEGGDLPQTAAVAKQARKLTRSPRISARATKQLDQIASRSAVKKDKSAGKELQQSVNSISPPATDSDTAAEEVKLSQSVTAAKQARKRTASRKMSVPASEQLDQSASGSPAKQNKPAGKELQQSVDSIPPSTEDSNAAAEGVNPLQSVTVAKQARKRTKSTKKSASPSKQADQTALGSAAEQDESAGNLKECSKA